MPTFRQSLVAHLARRYPLYSGCGSLANSAALRRLAGDSDESVWSRVPGGEVLASLDDYVGRSAFYVGDLDRKITWVCSRIVRPGDVVLDVGANIGMVTVWLSRLVGLNGRVHSFEPNPVLCERLIAAVDRNQLSNVQLHPFALGPTTSELTLCIPTHNAGAASLIRRADPSRSRAISVPVRRLSDVAASEGIRTIRFIKIDVEGFEDQVLEGSRELLEHVRPESVLFEMNAPVGQPVGDQPVMRLLKEYEYGFFAVPRRTMRMRLVPFDPDAVSRLEGHDVLAVSKGPSFGSIAAAVRAAA
jgi:FkbM family methyltransferase